MKQQHSKTSKATKGEADYQYACGVCGHELKLHERAEGFCDACLRAAQYQPSLRGADVRQT